MQPQFPFDVKRVGETGEIEGFANVYNVRDLSGDRVMPGAFTKTISERGGRIKLLYQHDVNRPIGVGQVVDSATGLIFRGNLALNTIGGRDAYEQLKAGLIDAMSIGYDVIKSRKGSDGSRLLTEIKLWEVSIVTFPANTAAVITDLKRTPDDDASDYASMLQGEVEDLKRNVLLQDTRSQLRRISRYAAALRKEPRAVLSEMQGLVSRMGGK